MNRFITLKGFIIGFVLSGLATAAVYAPVGFHIVTSGGVRGELPPLSFGLLPMALISTVVGCVLVVLSYIYCKKGVESLISNND